MAVTYEPISTTTLGSANTITFSSIPATYTDLVLVIVGGLSRASTTDNLLVRLNGDTGLNYSDTYLLGNGTTASSGRDSSQDNLFYAGIRMDGTTYGLTSNVIINFLNYSNTTTYKTALARGNSASAWGAEATVGLWRSTAAINSIYLAGQTSANFQAGTQATLYGIKAA